MVKLYSLTMTHKSDVGGVVLNWARPQPPAPRRNDCRPRTAVDPKRGSLNQWCGDRALNC